MLRFLKDLLDHFVLQIACVASIGLAFLELSLIPKSWLGDWVFWPLIVLFFANGLGLMWFWFRFGPTRDQDEEKPEDTSDVFK